MTVKRLLTGLATALLAHGALAIGASQAWVNTQITNAILTTRTWVGENFERKYQTQPEAVGITATGSATLDDGSVVQMRVNMYTPSNTVLWCYSSDTNAVPAGTLWTWDSVNEYYTSTNTAVKVKSRTIYSLAVTTNSMTRTVTTNVTENTELYALVGGVSWLTSEIGGRIQLWPSDGSSEGFIVQFTTVPDATYAALKASLVADMRSPLLSLLFTRLMADVQIYDLSPGPTQGSWHQSIYIGSITYTKGSKTFTFLGDGYTPKGLDFEVDLESWAYDTAKAIFEQVESSSSSTVKYDTLIDAAWDDKSAVIKNDVYDPECWGLQFPLSDGQGTTIAKGRFKASETWKAACQEVFENVQAEFKRLVNTDLKAYSTYHSPHDCPVPPEGGWTAPGGCLCTYVNAKTVQFANGTATKDDGGACPNAGTAQHIWGYYTWSGGNLTESETGCKLCKRCLTPYEDEGAIHAMVPESDEYDYCGCYCRYYYTAKDKEDTTEAVTESGDTTDITSKTEIVPITPAEAQEEIESGNAQDVITIKSGEDENGNPTYDHYIVKKTSQTNIVTQAKLSADDPRRHAYNFTIERDGEQKTVLISAGAAKNFNTKHKHVVKRDACWCYCGLYHEFKRSRCETACKICTKKKGDPAQKTETYTVGSGSDTHELTVHVDNLVETTEADHTPIMSADWTHYDEDGNEDGEEEIPQECGCACGKYRGKFVYGGKDLTLEDGQFYRSDFCNYLPYKTVTKQLGVAIGDNSMTTDVKQCVCWCGQSGNLTELEKDGRRHDMRPGDLCKNCCLSCGLTFASHTKTSTYIGTLGQKYDVYDQHEKTGREAILLHSPLTLDVVNGWIDTYATTAFNNMTDEQIATFLDCGCQCRAYHGASYPYYANDGISTSEVTNKVYHYCPFPDTECGCACSPNRHMQFLKNDDGCPNVCSGCGKFGLDDQGNDVVLGDDNWYKYHTKTAQAAATNDAEKVCGCACTFATNTYKHAAAKGCGDYNFDLFSGGKMELAAIREFHYYNDENSCKCKSEGGPHNFRHIDQLCPSICDGCTDKLAASGTDDKWSQWDGKGAGEDDHTWDSGRCSCQCGRYLKASEYAESGRTLSETLTCAECGKMYDVYDVTFTCKRCAGKDHEDLHGTYVDHNCESGTPLVDGKKYCTKHNIYYTDECPLCMNDSDDDNDDDSGNSSDISGGPDAIK